MFLMNLDWDIPSYLYRRIGIITHAVCENFQDKAKC